MNKGLFGVGSPFGDDQIGWLVVRTAVECGYVERFALSRIEALDRPGINLLERFAGLDMAVVVDAMQSGMNAGTIRRFEQNELGKDCRMLSGHGLGLAETLALGRSLDLLPGHVIVYGIEIGAAGATSQISASVEAAMSCLLEKLAADLSS
ncbi:MAG: hydrogenase maturation protease [Pseudomonadota bacterium]